MTQITFEQFSKSRSYGDISHISCVEDELSGYHYLDESFYIVEYLENDNVTPEQENRDLVVHIGNNETSFGDDLAAAEKFLWDNFAMHEANHELRLVKFSWAEDDSYEGYADGSTWNGFDNVAVTAEVHNNIVESYTLMQPLAWQQELKALLARPQSENRDDLINDINPFALIERNALRLYDYGKGTFPQRRPAMHRLFYCSSRRTT